MKSMGSLQKLRSTVNQFDNQIQKIYDNLEELTME